MNSRLFEAAIHVKTIKEWKEKDHGPTWIILNTDRNQKKIKHGNNKKPNRECEVTGKT